MAKVQFTPLESGPWLVVVAGWARGDPTPSQIEATIRRFHSRVFVLPVYRPKQLMGYSWPYVQQTISLIFDRIFSQGTLPSGEKSHSKGFCNYIGNSCLLNSSSGTCRKELDEKCGRQRPPFIVLFFANRGDTSLLVGRCYKFCYLQPISTSELWLQGEINEGYIRRCFAALESKYQWLSSYLRQHPPNVHTPLILPMFNFKVQNESIKRALLNSGNNGYDLASEHAAITDRLQIKDGKKGFRDERDLDFLPNKGEKIGHGTASISSNRETPDLLFALETFYRLGIPYHYQLHFHVSRKKEKQKLDHDFTCARNGPSHRIEKYINIYPNDFLR
jgi:hypothetical protein